jgi:hypothetical protein
MLGVGLKHFIQGFFLASTYVSIVMCNNDGDCAWDVNQWWREYLLCFGTSLGTRYSPY